MSVYEWTVGFAWQGSLRTRETACCWGSREAEDDGPLLPRSDGGQQSPLRTLRRLGAAGEAAAAGGAAGCRPCQAGLTNLCCRGEVLHIAAVADHRLLLAAAAATAGRAALVLIYTYSQRAACESWPDRGPTLARRDRQSLTKHAKRHINVSRMLPEIRMKQLRFARIEAKNMLMTTCSIEPLPIYKLIQR